MNDIKIGCEAYIVKNNKILLGKRGNVYGKNTWALPGGHLEFMERADDCLCRELMEEMGITAKVNDLELLAITDDIQKNNKIHYIHITFKVNIGKQVPKLLEPEECFEWRWFNLDELPIPFFKPHQKIFATINSQNTYTS